MEPGLGVRAIWGEEDAADVGCDFGAQVEARDVSLGVLLEVELAALPGLSESLCFGWFGYVVVGLVFFNLS